MARNQVSRVRPISDLIKHTNHASAGVHRREKRLEPARTLTRFLFPWSFANPTSWLDSPPTETTVPRPRVICTDLPCARTRARIYRPHQRIIRSLAAFSNSAPPCRASDLCSPFKGKERRRKRKLKMLLSLHGGSLFSNYDQIVCEKLCRKFFAKFVSGSRRYFRVAEKKKSEAKFLSKSLCSPRRFVCFSESRLQKM